MSKEWEDIKVNRRKKDRVVFESPLVQSIYDGVGHLKEETTEILKEMDTTEFRQRVDDFEIEEFGEIAMNHITDFADDLSRFKDNFIDRDDMPDIVMQTSRDAKVALNRDEDYIRRAKRRLDRLKSSELIDIYKTNIRVIELCDKAIAVNEENFEPYYLKGIALVNLQEYDAAIEQFINSLVYTDTVDARLAIANANRLNRDFNDAISVYNSVLAVDPYEALKGKAYVYYDWLKYGQANQCFRQASELHELDEESQKIWDEVRV